MSMKRPYKWEGPLDSNASGVMTVIFALFGFSLIFSIAAAHVFLSLSFLFWCGHLIKNRGKGFDWTPLRYPILFYFILSFISAITSREVLLSLYSFKEMLLFIILFLVLNSLIRTGQIDLIYKAIFVSMTLGAAFGLVEYFFFSEGGLISRVGVFHHYLTTSELFMMALLLILGRLLFYKDKWNFVLYPAFLVILTALVFTYARSAWIGFAGGVVILFYLRKPMLLLFIPILLLTVYVLSPSEVEDRMRSILDKKDPTVSERLYFYRSGIAMIKDHPLLGVGPDLANEYYPSYRKPEAPDRPIPHLHCNVIQIGAERGILGLLAWLFFFLKFFRDGWKTWRLNLKPEERYITGGSMAAVSAMMLAGLFEYNFGDSEIQMMTFFAIATLYVTMKTRERGR